MKVLVAEDDPVYMRELQSFLETWGYEVTHAPDGYVAMEVLKSVDPPRLAIVDWVLPGMDGLELCRELRKDPAGPYVYVLLSSDKRQKRDIVEGLDARADDYLSKPIDPGELRTQLQTGRRIIALQESLLSARDALRFGSTRDPLTGLLDRAGIIHALLGELERSQRQREPLAVVLGGLHHLDRISEKLGRMEADWALGQAAHRIQSGLRVYDTVGRYADDLFLAVVPRCDAARALKLAERLRASIQSRPFDLSDGPLPVTISVGLAASEDGKDADARTLIDAAFSALSRAKSKEVDWPVLATGLDLVDVRNSNPRIAAQRS